MRGAAKLTSMNYISERSTYVDINSCTNGYYYHNNDVGAYRLMEICVSGKNKAKF